MIKNTDDQDFDFGDGMLAPYSVLFNKTLTSDEKIIYLMLLASKRKPYMTESQLRDASGLSSQAFSAASRMLVLMRFAYFDIKKSENGSDLIFASLTSFPSLLDHPEDRHKLRKRKKKTRAD